ncbi:MAG TPA: hypothetical protein DD381_07160 [Lentisphaeria bacterium]|nr:MAG: hypothetical protein A2X47_05775 [Lentisphaerae bacterium GWF2_38_69]HBM16100.1 hypothetical protein [Lentisphaeria bacterium]
MNIEELRKNIDAVDDEIIDLIAKRYELVKEVGKIKESSSAAVFVPEREKRIMERLCAKSSFPKEIVSAVFREIISGARLFEHPITISYDKNDIFAIIATLSKFGSCINLKGFHSATEAVEAAENSLNTYAVIRTPSTNTAHPAIDIITINNPSNNNQPLSYAVIGKKI